MMSFRKFKRGTALFLSILLTLTSVPFSSAADTVDLTVAEEKTGNSQEAVFKEKIGEEETGEEDIVKEVTEIEEVKEDDSNTSLNEEPESENGTDRDKNNAEESLKNGNANGSSDYVMTSANGSQAARPVLRVFPLSNYVHGEPIANGTIDIGTNVEVEITSDYAYGSNLYMFKVEGDEVPPANLNNAGENVIWLKSEYKQIISDSKFVSHFAIWGANWDEEKKEFDEGMYLKYIMGKNEETFLPQTRFLEPGRYRFVYGLDDPDARIKANPVFYSDVFTVTDDTGMIEEFDQGLMDSSISESGESGSVSTLSQSGSYELNANGIDGDIKAVVFIKYNAGFGYNQEYVVYNEYDETDKTKLPGEVTGNKIKFGIAKSRESTQEIYDILPEGYYRIAVSDSAGKTYVDHKLYGVSEGAVGEFEVSVSSREAIYVPNGNFKTPITLTARRENFIGTGFIKAEVFKDQNKNEKLPVYINNLSNAVDCYCAEVGTTSGTISFSLFSVKLANGPDPDNPFLPQGAVITLSFYEDSDSKDPVDSFDITIGAPDFYQYSGQFVGEPDKKVSLCYYDRGEKYQVMDVRTDSEGRYILKTTSGIEFVDRAMIEGGSESGQETKTAHFLKAETDSGTKTGTIETVEFKEYSVGLEMRNIGVDNNGGEVLERMSKADAENLYKQAGFSCLFYGDKLNQVDYDYDNEKIIIREAALTSEIRDKEDYCIAISYTDPSGSYKTLNLSYSELVEGKAKITLKKVLTGHISTTLPSGINKDEYHFAVYVNENADTYTNSNVYRCIGYGDEADVTEYGRYMVAVSKNYVPYRIYQDSDDLYNSLIAFVEGTAGSGKDFNAEFTQEMLNAINQKTQMTLTFSNVNSTVPSVQVSITNVFAAGGKQLTILLPGGTTLPANKQGVVEAQLFGNGYNRIIRLEKESEGVYISDGLPDSADLKEADARLSFVMTKPTGSSGFVEIRTVDNEFLCGGFAYSVKAFGAAIGDNTGYRFPVAISNGEPGAQIKISGAELKQEYIVSLNKIGNYEGFVEIKDDVLVGNNVEFDFSYADGSGRITAKGVYSWSLSDENDPIDLFTVTDRSNNNWTVVLHKGANSTRPEVPDAHEYFYYSPKNPWNFDVYVNQEILKKNKKKMQFLAASITNEGGETKLVYMAQDDEDPSHYECTYLPDIIEQSQCPKSFGLRYCFRDDISYSEIKPGEEFTFKESETIGKQQFDENAASVTGITVTYDTEKVNYTAVGIINGSASEEEKVTITTETAEEIPENREDAVLYIDHCTLPNGEKGYVFYRVIMEEPDYFGERSGPEDDLVMYVWVENEEGTFSKPYNEVFASGRIATGNLSENSLQNEEAKSENLLMINDSVIASVLPDSEGTLLGSSDFEEMISEIFGAKASEEAGWGAPIGHHDATYNGYKVVWRDTSQWDAQGDLTIKCHCDVIIEVPNEETGGSEYIRINTKHPNTGQVVDNEELFKIQTRGSTYIEAESTRVQIQAEKDRAEYQANNPFTRLIKTIPALADLADATDEYGNLKEDQTVAGLGVIGKLKVACKESGTVVGSLVNILSDVPDGVKILDGIESNLDDMSTAIKILNNYGNDIAPEYKQELESYVMDSWKSYLKNIYDIGKLTETRAGQTGTMVVAGATAAETGGQSKVVNAVLQKMMGDKVKNYKSQIYGRIDKAKQHNGRPIEKLFQEALKSRKKASSGDNDDDGNKIGPQNDTGKNDGSGSTQTPDSGNKGGEKKKPADNNKPDDGKTPPIPEPDDETEEEKKDRKKAGKDDDSSTDKWYHAATDKVKTKLDPSGIVFYEETGLPARETKMIVYVSDSSDGNGAFAWVNRNEEGDAGDAAYASIGRPDEWDEPGVQITDSSGYYQWNVPTGYYYQVRAYKNGYKTAASEWMYVPPIRLGIDLYLKKDGSQPEEEPDDPSKPSSGGGGSWYKGRANSRAYFPSYVVTGVWSQDEYGNWMFRSSSHSYKDEWGAIYNPYAPTGEEKYGWFHFDENGFMQTGWLTDKDKRRYFLNPDSDGTKGKMVTGWKLIEGRWYYFNTVSDGYRGALLTNTWTPDGFWVNADGQWDESVKQRQQIMASKDGD